MLAFVWIACVASVALFGWDAPWLQRLLVLTVVLSVALPAAWRSICLRGRRAIVEIEWLPDRTWFVTEAGGVRSTAALSPATRQLGGRWLWIAFRVGQARRGALVDRRAVDPAGYVRLQWRLRGEAFSRSATQRRPVDRSC